MIRIVENLIRDKHLPFGDDLFDFASVNANGLTIIKRSLEWAHGLMIHWKVDETAGTTAADDLGGFDGTLNNMDPGTDWVASKIDNGLDFDGTNDYFDTSTVFSPPPKGTVAFWMKVPGSPGSHGRILGITDKWEIRHVTTGTPDGIAYGLVFDLGWTGVNGDFVTTVTVDAANTWYHVAATYDTATDAYAVYLDGALHKSGTAADIALADGPDVLSVGTRTGSSNYFVGTLDDIRIMDYVMTADEIAALKALGSGITVTGWRQVHR